MRPDIVANWSYADTVFFINTVPVGLIINAPTIIGKVLGVVLLPSTTTILLTPLHLFHLTKEYFF